MESWPQNPEFSNNPENFHHADRPEQKVQSQIRLIMVFVCEASGG